jgi:hypothetical protein
MRFPREYSSQCVRSTTLLYTGTRLRMSCAASSLSGASSNHLGLCHEYPTRTCRRLHIHEVLEADTHNLPTTEYLKNKRKIKRPCYEVFIVNGMDFLLISPTNLCEGEISHTSRFSSLYIGERKFGY